MDFIEELAQRIDASEGQKLAFSQALSRLKGVELNAPSALDPFISRKVPQAKAQGSYAAVDGGLLLKSFHGSDLAMARATCAMLSYDNGVLKGSKYHPSPSVQPQVYCSTDGIEREEAMTFASLCRIRCELETAITATRELRPDYLLMDGSVLPQNADKPRTGSQLNARYRDLLSLYEELFNAVEKNGTQLVGVVEDSRGNRFMSILKNEVMAADPTLSQFSELASKTYDTHFLYYFLEKGERTFSFKYSQSPEDHPLLADLPEASSKVIVSYLKTAQYDRPVRIEFLSGATSRSADEVCSAILAVSGQHPEYGFPAPLIEADLRAKLGQKELDFVYSRVFDKLKNKAALMRLRREQRPFS